MQERHQKLTQPAFLDHDCWIMQGARTSSTEYMSMMACMDEDVNSIDQLRDAWINSQVSKSGSLTIQIAPIEKSLGDVDWSKMNVC